MKFETLYRKPRHYFSAVGSRDKITYSPRFRKDGSWVLEESGKQNVYEYIQSFAKSVDLALLIARYNAGDKAALQRVQGMYGDFTRVPESFADMLNFIHATHDNFDSLPAKIKQQFGNNFAAFAQMATDDPKQWFEILGGEDHSEPQPEQKKGEEVSA